MFPLHTVPFRVSMEGDLGPSWIWSSSCDLLVR